MSNVAKYFYKGHDTDLIVFVKSKDAVEEYLTHSDNISDVVEVFQIFTNTNTGRGNEGSLGEASIAQLENEFGKMKKDDMFEKILREGEFSGDKNGLRRQDRFTEKGF